MGFEVGGTVGPYKITSYIGQGGMATIYRAHQLTLDRDVALKVIHPALKDDPSFLARLNREASIVAKLNHPNIVTVYDSGECEGQPYLVMRLIEGKTLKAILQERRLETAEILRIARAVADALIYAHAHGVLHRDVKTSNILIDQDASAYLTDFGLARLAYSGESTLSRDMLIGSPQYISPEQAKGEPVDIRSDIYSFGIVLFEMFTGRVPFAGETPYATIMSHINDPVPSARSFNPSIPLAVQVVLEKALAKDREQRYASIADMIAALENAVHGPQAADEQDTAPILLDAFADPALATADDEPAMGKRTPADKLTSVPPKVALLVGLGVVALCMVAFCSVLWGFRSLTPLGLLFPSGTSAISFGFASPITTPTRSIPFSPSTPLPVSKPTATAARPPAASPIAAADAPRGRIAYSIATSELPEHHSIYVASGSGANPRQVADTALWPALAPDGKMIAYYRMRDSGIYVADSDGSGARRVIPYSDTCCVQWSPDSKQLAYFRGNLRIGGAIFTANVDGSNITEITTGFNPAWSADGGRLAYTSCQPNTSTCGIFVIDLKTKASTMVTRDNGGNPQWSPRGDKIVYQADDGKGHVNVFVVNADGSGGKQLTSGRGNDGQPVWSRDANYIFWRSDQNGGGWAVFAMRADGSSPRLVVKEAPVTPQWGRESLSAGP